VTVKSHGEATVGAFNPFLVSAIAAGQAAIGSTLPNLQAQLTAATAAVANLTATPPTLAAQLVDALSLVAAIQAAIVVGDPGVSGQLTALASLVASLTVEVGVLEAQVAAFAELTAGLSAFGVEAYTYNGPCSDFASELGSFTNGGFAGGSPGTQSYAVVLGATSPTVWATLSGALGVSGG